MHFFEKLRKYANVKMKDFVLFWIVFFVIIWLMNHIPNLIRSLKNLF